MDIAEVELSIAVLAGKWRKEADELQDLSRAYKRSCVEGKSVQLILLARQKRGMADELEKAVAALV